MRYLSVALKSAFPIVLMLWCPCVWSDTPQHEQRSQGKRSCINRTAEEIKAKVAKAGALYAVGQPDVILTTTSSGTKKEFRKISQQIIILIDQDGGVHVLMAKCIASCFSIGGPDCQLSGCNWYTPGCSACTCTPTEECSECDCEFILEDLGSPTRLTPDLLLSSAVVKGNR